MVLSGIFFEKSCSVAKTRFWEKILVLATLSVFIFWQRYSKVSEPEKSSPGNPHILKFFSPIICYLNLRAKFFSRNNCYKSFLGCVIVLSLFRSWPKFFSPNNCYNFSWIEVYAFLIFSISEVFFSN